MGRCIGTSRCSARGCTSADPTFEQHWQVRPGHYVSNVDWSNGILYVECHLEYHGRILQFRNTCLPILMHMIQSPIHQGCYFPLFQIRRTQGSRAQTDSFPLARDSRRDQIQATTIVSKTQQVRSTVACFGLGMSNRFLEGETKCLHINIVTWGQHQGYTPCGSFTAR